MPTYEYRCRACDHEFERFQRMSDSPVRTCPSCKKRRVERLISLGGGIVFKGTGFYATDYRKEGPSERSEAKERSESEKSSSDSEPKKSKSEKSEKKTSVKKDTDS